MHAQQMQTKGGGGGGGEVGGILSNTERLPLQQCALRLRSEVTRTHLDHAVTHEYCTFVLISKS